MSRHVFYFARTDTFGLWKQNCFEANTFWRG